MPLRSSVAFAALGVLLVPLPSRAADCADGWFCEEPPSAPAPARPPPAPMAPSSVAPVRPPPPPQESPPQPPLAVPPPPAQGPATEIAFNLHLALGLLGPGADTNAGLGGIGFGFRIRPKPLYAVDLGLEFLGGTDYNGNDRAEQAFVANAVVFVNPRDRVQAFVVGGVQIGGAQARIEELGGTPVPLHDVAYTYLGAQGGLGVEWRFSRGAALTGDFLLFVRGRVDGNTYYEPEYVDPDSHLVTNTSGGGLFRLGATFYF
jgi:hypothetical protein